MISPKRTRISITIFFFMAGLCFASWASRIPDIQNSLKLNEAALGTVLFALPAGLMVSLFFSGWMVTRFGSKRAVIAGIAEAANLRYSFALIAVLGFCITLLASKAKILE
jgi:MFS family permease